MKQNPLLSLGIKLDPAKWFNVPKQWGLSVRDLWAPAIDTMPQPQQPTQTTSSSPMSVIPSPLSSPAIWLQGIWWQMWGIAEAETAIQTTPAIQSYSSDVFSSPETITKAQQKLMKMGYDTKDIDELVQYASSKYDVPEWMDKNVVATMALYNDPTLESYKESNLWPVSKAALHTTNRLRKVFDKQEISPLDLKRQWKPALFSEMTRDTSWWRFAADVQGTIIGKPIEFIGNTASFFAGLVNDELGKSIKWVTDKTLSSIKQEIWSDEESFASLATSFLADAWVALASAPVWALWAAKIGNIASQSPKLAQTLQTITTKFPQLWKILSNQTVWKVARLWLEWAIDTGIANVVTTGDLDMSNVALWAGVWWAIPLLWKWLDKGIQAFKKMSTVARDKLQLSGLLNPAKLQSVANRLQQQWDEVSDVVDWMLDRNIQGKKEQVIEQLGQKAKETSSLVSKQITKAAKTSTDRFSDQDTVWALELLKKVLAGSQSSELAWEYKNVISMLQKAKKWWLDVEDLQKTKKMMDKQLNIYKKDATIREWVSKQDMDNIRKSLRKKIEDVVAKETNFDIRKANRDTAVAMELMDAIKRKDKADAVREILSPFAPSIIGGGIGWFTWEGNLFDRLKWVVIGMTIGSITGSTKSKMMMARFFDKLSWTGKREVVEYFLRNGKKTPTIKKMEKIIDKADTIAPNPTKDVLQTTDEVAETTPTNIIDETVETTPTTQTVAVADEVVEPVGDVAKASDNADIVPDEAMVKQADEAVKDIWDIDKNLIEEAKKYNSVNDFILTKVDEAFEKWKSFYELYNIIPKQWKTQTEIMKQIREQANKPTP